MPIFRRKNCIHTASGVFTLCKRLHSTLVESGLNKENCALKLVDEIILTAKYVYYVCIIWLQYGSAGIGLFQVIQSTRYRRINAT